MNSWFIPWVISIALFAVFATLTAQYESIMRFNLVYGNMTYYSLMLCIWYSLSLFLVSWVKMERHLVTVLNGQMVNKTKGGNTLCPRNQV